MDRQRYLTRKDENVGVGEFDSIAWAFEVHVKQPDRPELQFAVMHGHNEDAPDYIDFYQQAEPSYFDVPALTWRAEAAKILAGDEGDDPLAECRRLLEAAQDAQYAYEDALGRLERGMEKVFGESLEIEGEDISEGVDLEDLIAQHGLEMPK